MFERFTKEARAAVVASQEIARETGTTTIDTRHLTLALLRGQLADAIRDPAAAPESIATSIRSDLTGSHLDKDALATLGVDLDAITARAEETFGPGALDRPRRNRKHRPFTKDAKKALELALREAIRLGEKRIETRRLLLGILRADCPGRRALTTTVDAAALRHAVEGAAAA